MPARATETPGSPPGPAAAAPALEPGLRADTAVKIVLEPLLETLETQEGGVRVDQEPECLHDFRVAMRRSRALLAQLKQVFEPQVAEWFRQEYRWLGQMTGPVRDLDVFLERLAKEQQALPAERRASVARLTAELKAERESARAQMLAALDSARYRALKRSAHEFLALPAPERSAPKNARRAVRNVVADCLRRAYQRVRTEGREVQHSTPIAMLHQLRIHCKKLRYLLDAFGPLFDEEDIKTLEKRLRRLQDRLGNIHDCEVQGQSLRAWRQRLESAGIADAELMLAIGCLDERNRRRQKKARKRLRKHLEAFCGPSTRKRVRRLVKST